MIIKYKEKKNAIETQKSENHEKLDLKKKDLENLKPPRTSSKNLGIFSCYNKET